MIDNIVLGVLSGLCVAFFICWLWVLYKLKTARLFIERRGLGLEYLHGEVMGIIKPISNTNVGYSPIVANRRIEPLKKPVNKRIRGVQDFEITTPIIKPVEAVKPFKLFTKKVYMCQSCNKNEISDYRFKNNIFCDPCLKDYLKKRGF